MEAIIVEKEENLEENDLEKEMEWVQDPDTATTQPTKYVHTQAETWRMKMMLAKAISMQGEYLNQAHQDISVLFADHTVVLQALDLKISSLEQQFGNIFKKLIVLISLLRHSICQDVAAVGEGAEETMGTSQGKCSSQRPPHLGRATTSVGQDSSTNDSIVLGL